MTALMIWETTQCLHKTDEFQTELFTESSIRSASSLVTGCREVQQYIEKV
jgi:hypothetical protein